VIDYYWCGNILPLDSAIDNVTYLHKFSSSNFLDKSGIQILSAILHLMRNLPQYSKALALRRSWLSLHCSFLWFPNCFFNSELEQLTFLFLTSFPGQFIFNTGWFPACWSGTDQLSSEFHCWLLLPIWSIGISDSGTSISCFGNMVTIKF